MGRGISRQERAETLAKAASSGADTLRAHAEQAATTARATAAAGLHAAQDAVHGSGALQDATSVAAGPARDAARQLAYQVRHTAGTLTARAGHPGHDRRSWPTRALIVGGCALGAGTLVWWLARTPEERASQGIPLQPVPPA